MERILDKLLEKYICFKCITLYADKFAKQAMDFSLFLLYTSLPEYFFNLYASREKVCNCNLNLRIKSSGYMWKISFAVLNSEDLESNIFNEKVSLTFTVSNSHKQRELCNRTLKQELKCSGQRICSKSWWVRRRISLSVALRPNGSWNIFREAALLIEY